MPHAEAWSTEARQYIFGRWREVAMRYGFREYDGPPLETVELFTAKSGQEILGQLYNFVDKGDRAVALRPEMTPTLARLVAAHHRHYKKPLKWFALPQLFRYERQQKGRLREHFQFNADIIGEADVAADAELIALLVDSLRSFGLGSDDFVVRLSSRQAWQQFYRDRRAEAPGEEEFYQVVDKLEREPPQESERKLAALGMGLEEVLRFIREGQPSPALEAILRDLNARGLGAFLKVDYQVIRGLAYYTGVVFEAFDRRGEFRAIAGGGRYDHLIKLVSGNKVDLPSLGFGMGDVVLLELLKARGLLPGFRAGLDVFCLIEDEAWRGASLGLIQALRAGGCSVDYCLTQTKPDKQFKRALEAQAAYTVRVEGAPGGEAAVRVKNLATRAEEVQALNAAVAQLAAWRKAAGRGGAG